jgi:hypothetical protein
VRYTFSRSQVWGNSDGDEKIDVLLECEGGQTRSYQAQQVRTIYVMILKMFLAKFWRLFVQNRYIDILSFCKNWIITWIFEKNAISQLKICENCRKS